VQNTIRELKEEEEEEVIRHRKRLCRMDVDRDRRLDDMDRQVPHLISFNTTSFLSFNLLSFTFKFLFFE
jgi:hypothetical protein